MIFRKISKKTQHNIKAPTQCQPEQQKQHQHIASEHQLDCLQWRTNTLIKNSSSVTLTTIFGKGFYLNFEDKIEFSHKNKQLISEILKKLKFVWENVLQLSITPLDHYNVNILIESKYKNDGAFSNIVFNESTRQFRLANERNVHEYLHSITDNHSNSNININPSTCTNNNNNNGDTNRSYAVKMQPQRGNSVRSIVGMDLVFEKKNDRMTENINQLDLKQFEIKPQSLGYFIVFFRFFEKNDSTNDNNNEDDRYGKIEKILYKQNQNKNNKNILIENVYQMKDNNNIYCIVISSFALKLSFKLQYDFGIFLYDSQIGKSTTMAGRSGSGSNSGSKIILFERKSFVLIFFFFCAMAKTSVTL